MAAGIQQTFLLESNGFTVEVAVAETYEVSANTSNVSVGLRIKSAYATGNQYLSGFVKLDGKTLVTMDSTISTHNVPVASSNTWYNVVRSSDAYTDSPWTLANIVHNTDGSRTVSLELELRGYGDDSYLSLRVAATKTITLTHIPQASAAGASDANIGAVSTISVIRRSTAYSHSIAYKFGALSGYIHADGTVSAAEKKLTQTSIPFLLPESFYGQIPNSPTGTCVLTVRTYAGNDRIGDDQITRFTVTAAKALCAPQISGRVEDINPRTIALTGDQNVLVRHASNALCAITAAARNSASIVSKEIGGVKISEDSLRIDGVETGDIMFSCADTRGYTASVRVKKSLVPYIQLTAGVTAGRKDPTSGRAWLAVTGNWFCGSFGAEENTIAVNYCINGGSSVAMNVTTDGNTYKAETELTGLDYQKSYTITVTAADKLETVTKSVPVGKGIPVFDWDEDDFQFHVPVNLNADCDILKNGTAAYAPSGYGYDGNKSPRLLNITGDADGSMFNNAIDNMVAAMPNRTVQQILFVDTPCLGGYEHFGSLYRHNANYCVVTGWSYSGKVITKVKNNGSWSDWVDGSQSAFAPSGYGLGEAVLVSMNNIDTLTRPGWYYSNTSATIAGFANNRWWIHVKAYGTGATFAAQELYSFNGSRTIKLERLKSNEAWKEWKFNNPPMLLGTEYITTEYWNGEPVYTKLLAWTSTADMQYVGRYEIPHGISNLDSSSLRIVWTTEEWTLPHINTDEALYISGVDTAQNSTKLVIKTTGNALWGAGRTFYFYMKYCKK